MSAYDVTLVVSLLVLGFYAQSGIKNIGQSKSYESFYLSDRRLTRENVRNTFAGAAISIATVLVFFLTVGINFGWWILWSPLTLALGVVFFNFLVYPKLIKRQSLVASINDRSENGITSLFGIVEHLYGSRLLAGVVTSVSALGVIAILVAEMMVGVTIFEDYFVNPQYIVLLIAVTLFFYAGLGGLRSVVQTDKVQVRLIVLSLALIIISFGFISLTDKNISESQKWLDWSPRVEMPLALIVNIFIVNIALLPASLRVWQVVVATDSRTDFRKALWGATWLIVFVSLAALIISKFVLVRSGDAPASILSVFEFLTEGPQWIAYTLYPLFVAALLSALISTADSSVLPLAQAIAASNKSEFNGFRNTKIIAVLVAIVVVAYFGVTSLTGMTLVPWILTVFAISTCVAPVIVIPLLMPDQKPSPLCAIVVSIGLVVACAAALTWSIKYAGDFYVQPWNCAIGFGISATVTLLSLYVLAERKEQC